MIHYKYAILDEVVALILSYFLYFLLVLERLYATHPVIML